MKMERARAEFCERLYNWALEEWRQEIKEDFPLLREMEKGKVVGVHEILEIMKTIEKDQQWLMARALVRNFWASQSGKLTDKDKQLFELSRDMRRKIRDEEASKITPFRYLTKELHNKLKRSKLKRYVIDNLRPLLGEKNKEWSSHSIFVYITPIGKFLIMTWVDTGGCYHQLSYQHTIVAYDAIGSGRVNKASLCKLLSLLSWLGIGQSEWGDLLDEDAEPTAKLLAKLIAHFMNAAPKLLEGLSPDD